jgi:adenine-specific DNA glycosylase
MSLVAELDVQYPRINDNEFLYRYLQRITPKFIFRRFNYGLLDFTRNVWKPKEPDCRICPLKKKCSFLIFS